MIENPNPRLNAPSEADVYLIYSIVLRHLH